MENTFEQVAKVIESVKAASGNEKLYILAKHKDDELLKNVLRFIYNPYVKTGISNAKLNKVTQAPGVVPSVTTEALIGYFTKNQTGAMSDINMAHAFINSTDPSLRWLVRAMVTQDLQIGVSVTSLNKVFGASFIPVIGCILGRKIDTVTKIAWPCIITEKLDGIRRLLVKQDGVCKFYSRSGHEADGHDELIEEARHLPNGFVYDGELLAVGEFDSNVALRQASSSRSAVKGLKIGLSFNIFDMISLDEFNSRKFETPALHRKIRLAATLKDVSLSIIDEEWAARIAAFGLFNQDFKLIRPVPIIGLARNMQDVEEALAKLQIGRDEGLMLNTANGLYKIGRSADLIKVKFSEELILPIIGFIPGEGKFEDTLGAIVVDYKGSKVGVGSGFTDYERDLVWNNRDKYLHTRVEIETFGESMNALTGLVSLNCPIFKGFVK